MCFFFVCMFVFLGFTFEIASVHFLFYYCKKFADIVAVIIDDIVDDCFLTTMIFMAF